MEKLKGGARRIEMRIPLNGQEDLRGRPHLCIGGRPVQVMSAASSPTSSCVITVNHVIMQHGKAMIECGLVAKRCPRAIPICLEAPCTHGVGTSMRPLVALDLEG